MDSRVAWRGWGVVRIVVDGAVGAVLGVGVVVWEKRWRLRARVERLVGSIPIEDRKRKPLGVPPTLVPPVVAAVVGATGGTNGDGEENALVEEEVPTPTPPVPK